ncbi:MAG: hypothetical protein GX070_07075 [Alcaligenaceae bacterium]|nr:hypothetical protein [Alcaligenaceae bacterium]
MHWQARLDKWFDKDHYTISNQNDGLPNRIEVIEEASDGQGRIEFFGTNHLLKINSGNLNHLPFLKDTKNADGVFLELENSKPLALHIVELKKTINLTKWDEVKSQIRSSLRHSLGFLGVLNLTLPEKLVCHTCYQNDDIQKDRYAKPVLSKPIVGKLLNSKKPDFLEEWLGQKVNISTVFPGFEHKKHQMTSIDGEDIPYAEVRL